MSGSFSLLFAQMNCVVGNIDDNCKQIIQIIEQAKQDSVDIVMFPELALSGYFPEDLLFRDDFHQACHHVIEEIKCCSQGITVILGMPIKEKEKYFNAVMVFRDGKIQGYYKKQKLPNEEVFDEKRYFTSGKTPFLFEQNGIMIGVLICEDLWHDAPVKQAVQAGAQCLLSVNASPFYINKLKDRHARVMHLALEYKRPFFYGNLVGGQDELIFDGASFAVDAGGKMNYQATVFQEERVLLTYHQNKWHSELKQSADYLNLLEEYWNPCKLIYQALKMGVHDYVEKNGFPGVVIGLSGGIDSALTLCIAVDALGADRVFALMMPSPYTAQMSLDDARQLVANLGVRYQEVSIESAMNNFSDLLTPILSDWPASEMDTTSENIQSRIRGLLLMALSNRSGRLVLTTGNKSEMAVGYATLYGDMAGGLAVLKDVCKTKVYQLANWRNQQHLVIPQNIIDRPPSAELRPMQLDQDSLPPYDILDRIIEAYVEHNASIEQMLAEGLVLKDIQKVVHLLRRNEYKRQQSAIGIRVTKRAFGKDWRFPVTNHFHVK